MSKRFVRDLIKLFWSIIFFWLYIPHLTYYFVKKNNSLILSDIILLKAQINLKICNGLALLWFLHNSSYYRSLFYYRTGPVFSALFSWYRKRNPYFIISYETKIAEGFYFAHPYSTVINAKQIGSNFKCIHCTTVGKTPKGRPIIGNNVSLGANVVIIGNIKIGDNVIIGAGAVVVKDIPDNAVVVGNPAHVIKYNPNN